jgi:superfamily II DNA or RNA helicase
MFVLDESVSKEDFDLSNKHKIIKMLDESKVHIFDECHICAASTARSIYNAINAESIYGMSGTPWRDSGDDILITGILGENIIDINASRLIDAGVLVPPIIKFVTVPSVYTTATTYQQMYKEYIVENPVRNALIVENTRKLVEKGYPTLALFKTIRHGEILLELMQEAGIKCALLSGKDNLKYRTEIKRQLEDKEIDVILASTIFDIGLDLTPLSGLVLCGSGKSSIRALQRIGRVIRSHPGKKRAIVIDFYDQARWLKNHSKARYQIYKSEKGFEVLPLKVTNS